MWRKNRIEGAYAPGGGSAARHSPEGHMVSAIWLSRQPIYFVLSIRCSFPGGSEAITHNLLRKGLLFI